jgi:2-furoyl-CoA dehydrogenase large subunit
LNTETEDIVFGGGYVGSKRNPDNRISFSRVAGLSHWSPAALPDGVDHTIRETVFWTPPELIAPDEEDHVNSSLCHGFIFDFCGVEIDRTTLQTRIDRYISMHDCGTILHPAMVDGQIRGGFAQALGAALYEEYAYDADGSFLTGTFADYLLPTTAEVPDPVIIHMQTPSPFTPLGSKGVGEGNCMSTPVCIANAVADALGVNDLELPLVPAKLAALARGAEPAPPAGRAGEGKHERGDRRLRGEGEAMVGAPVHEVWNMLLDPATLSAVIPGCHHVQKISDTHFRADVTLGIGPVKGRYRADVKLSDLDPPHGVTLGGAAEGALGFGSGEGRITLRARENGGTAIAYVYEAGIGGKLASIGGRLLDGAARVIIGQFFASLARKAGGGARHRTSLLSRLRHWLGEKE